MSVWSHTKKWSTHVDTGSHFELRENRFFNKNSKGKSNFFCPTQIFTLSKGLQEKGIIAKKNLIKTYNSTIFYKFLIGIFLNFKFLKVSVF